MGLKLELLIDFEGTARWRREKAIEYPNDKRNIEAAEALERLGKDFTALVFAPATEQLRELELYLEHHDGLPMEAVGEHLRAVAFSSSPASIGDFLDALIDDLRRGSRS
ncbi:hypothetical protein GOD82_15010 [Sinorhizobium medicae]|uniref:hypothetical protein n=1 Tax=Sinorhizobium medicae TaxID=110321 RepID=UPI00035F7B6B|nr:hypothetical protein [Sinorhizobium medicae]MDX0831231.1 hypothetical protein [Sinorhizobium medicae]RVI57148.1 hypothetical protein CN192_11625 [Sinorhizobium medicae]UFX00305.1 hypothetical protein SmedWSM1115_10815 [Sinorhizobium medicae WSM1115]